MPTASANTKKVSDLARDFPSVIEFIMAGWNRLAWKFQGKAYTEERNDGLTFFRIEGRTIPVFWSPFYWLHFVICYIFRFHFLLTSKGRENFNIYYHMFLNPYDEENSVIYTIQGLFVEGSSPLGHKAYLFMTKFTRVSAYLMDLNEQCDKELDGNIWKYLAFITIKFITKPVELLFDELPSYVVFLWNVPFMRQFLNIDVGHDKIVRRMERAMLYNYLRKFTGGPMTPMVTIPMGITMWGLIIYSIQILLF